MCLFSFWEGSVGLLALKHKVFDYQLTRYLFGIDEASMDFPLICQEISASPLTRTQKEAVSPSVTIAGRGVLMNSTEGEISARKILTNL